MYKKGSRFFYDTVTGVVFFEIREQEYGFDAPFTSVEHDVATFPALYERNPSTFDCLEIEFGQYKQDFDECIGFRVNPETKTLEFSYPDPNEPAVEQPYQTPLSEKVKQLELAQSVTDTTLLELMETLLQ